VLRLNARFSRAPVALVASAGAEPLTLQTILRGLRSRCSPICTRKERHQGSASVTTLVPVSQPESILARLHRPKVQSSKSRRPFETRAQFSFLTFLSSEPPSAATVYGSICSSNTPEVFGPFRCHKTLNERRLLGQARRVCNPQISAGTQRKFSWQAWSPTSDRNRPPKTRERCANFSLD